MTQQGDKKPNHKRSLGSETVPGQSFLRLPLQPVFSSGPLLLSHAHIGTEEAARNPDCVFHLA